MDNELADKIRGNKGEIDAERGKSTGRERELGWLDIPELRTAIVANGVTELFLAKLDWIPKTGVTMIAESYTIDGKIEEFAPSDSADHLRKAKPNYITLPTWDTPIDKIRDFDELPPEARRYITTIEDLVGVPITKIGVGPYRGQFINRPARS
jgi:adenylosuccinate synthase